MRLSFLQVKETMRNGKSYHIIMEALARAKEGGPDLVIWVSSESMKKRVEEIAQMIGQSVTVKVAPKLEGLKR